MEVEKTLDVLSQTAQIGIILLGQEGKIEFVSKYAKKLMTTDASVSLDDNLASLLNELSAPIESLRNTAMLERHIEIERGAGDARLRLHIELHARSRNDWRGCTLLLQNLDRMDALEVDLRAATHDRALSFLHGGMAHNLRAPLNAMLMNLELLRQSLEKDQEDTQEDLLERQCRYVDVLAEEVMRANRLLKSFLDQYTPSPSVQKDLDLAVIIDELVALLTTQARMQRIKLNINVNRPLYSHGFPGEIKQALLNVLINGLEAIPEGGTLTITGEWQGNTNLVTVSDSGPGITPALADKIFTMHFTTKPSKTGIGLYVARRTIENHGGKITVSTSHDKGACVNIELPKAIIQPFSQ